MPRTDQMCRTLITVDDAQLAGAIQPAAQPALNSLASMVASLFVSTMVKSIM